ncbi:MAG: metalloregulator ArsR/SmtB family transcription factor [Myxococcales bacterium]|nr:metalloregulator ArsR/SmtB family transcription factor [Myxococcales bacterium]MDH5307162.1 metalloregulator ArsR/SmtB family transcription factor [Myxococcales bacterium]MDH5566860.1 metalloregulator ArsR/SmtB family transcription factor [Myxococcales bacterium]
METLQKVFKTFADPTRVRALALLEQQELAVQELMDVLGMAQSRVSRHLAILREAGLLRDRRDGTYVFYRFAVPEAGPWRDAWELVRASLQHDATRERDVAALGQVMQARAARTRSFFDAVGPEWDALRKVFNDDALRARAISRLVDPGLTVVDVGTGTGILAAELARLGLRVVAVDHSMRMIDAARSKFAAEHLEGIELRHGEAGALPLADREVDAALAHMVLQHLPSPGEAIREMARCVRCGGAVVVVDFVRHEHEWMRQELGVTWLGFEQTEVESWFRDAHLEPPLIQIYAGASASRDLPGTFIASARRSES